MNTNNILLLLGVILLLFFIMRKATTSSNYVSTSGTNIHKTNTNIIYKKPINTPVSANYNPYKAQYYN
jgi:hypothetical protein